MASPVEAASARDGFAITASDTTVFRADALWVGTGGTVTLITSRGTSLAFVVPDGTLLPIACTKVMSTGTVTATAFIGLVY